MPTQKNAKPATQDSSSIDVQRLQEQLAKVTLERDILKKATALNSKDVSHLTGTFFETRRHAKEKGLEWSDWSI